MCDELNTFIYPSSSLMSQPAATALESGSTEIEHPIPNRANRDIDAEEMVGSMWSSESPLSSRVQKPGVFANALVAVYSTLAQGNLECIDRTTAYTILCERACLAQFTTWRVLMAIGLTHPEPGMGKTARSESRKPSQG